MIELAVLIKLNFHKLIDLNYLTLCGFHPDMVGTIGVYAEKAEFDDEN